MRPARLATGLILAVALGVTGLIFGLAVMRLAG